MIKQITLQDGNRVLSAIEEIKSGQSYIDVTNASIGVTEAVISANPFIQKIVATIFPYTLPDIPILEERKLTAESYLKYHYPTIEIKDDYDKKSNRFTYHDLIDNLEEYHSLRCSLMSSVSDQDIINESFLHYPSLFNDIYSNERKGFMAGAKFIQSNKEYSEEQMKHMYENGYERAVHVIAPNFKSDLNELKPSPRTITEDDIKRGWYWVL